MSTYCERAGLALQTIRFSFDGTRINESDTPKGLDMEDGDTIEVFQQQSGGSNHPQMLQNYRSNYLHMR